MDIIEFLISQKEEVDRYERLAKNCKDSDGRSNYEEQKNYCFHLCCMALNSFRGRKVPGFLREYILGLRKEKPTLEELQNWHRKSREWDVAIPLGIKIAFVTALAFALIAVIFS